MELDVIVDMVNGCENELGERADASPLFVAIKDNVASVGDVVFLSLKVGVNTPAF